MGARDVADVHQYAVDGDTLSAVSSGLSGVRFVPIKDYPNYLPEDDFIDVIRILHVEWIGIQGLSLIFFIPKWLHN